MKSFEFLKNKAIEILDKNSHLHDNSLRFFIEILKSTEKRLEKFKINGTLLLEENRAYIDTYAFYIKSCEMRLDILSDTVQEIYTLPVFNSSEDLDLIFRDHTQVYEVIIVKSNQEYPSETYLISEDGLKIRYTKSLDEAYKVKSKTKVIIICIEDINYETFI
jgi:hypothetical protein